MIKILGVKIV